ncbi:MAG: hypothetical protein AB7F28_07985 [Candidatus Margulisiibacteriota bacterium]
MSISFNPNVSGHTPLRHTDLSVGKHFNTPELKEILSLLHISLDAVGKVSRQPGLNVNVMEALQEIQVVHIQHEQQAALHALGIHESVDLALVVGAEKEELERIKKRFKDLKASISDQDSIKQLGGFLGIDDQDETWVLSDHHGGLFIIQAGLDEVKTQS